MFAESEAWVVTEKGTKLKEDEPARIAAIAKERKEKRIAARAEKKEEKRSARQAAEAAGEAVPEATPAPPSGKKHQDRRKEKRAVLQAAYAAAEASRVKIDLGVASADIKIPKETKKEKKAKQKAIDDTPPTISEERMRAYGSGGLGVDRARLNAKEKSAGIKAMEKSRNRGEKAKKSSKRKSSEE